MPRRPLSPLDYVHVMTKIPLHMHRWYTVQSAAFGIDRMTLYMFALRFAFQSNTEFKEFVKTIIVKGGHHANNTK